MLIKYCYNYVIFGLETTGFSPETDAVVELSALKVRDGEIVDEFSTLINPEMHIPYTVSSINGITDDLVKEAPTMETVIKQFIGFIGDDVLLGHNIKRFDLKFIQCDALRFVGKTITNDYVDTLIVAQRYLPDISSLSLEALSDHYEISYLGAHRALTDCNINKQVYDCLGNEIANPSEAAKEIKSCPRCGNVLKKRKGIYGEFWGCASYPDCKFIRNITKLQQRP